MYFAVIYDTVDDYIRRREPFRQAHLLHARRAQESGLLIMAGAFNPADRALLVFKAEDVGPVEQFVRADPYVQNGLVQHTEIREWTIVLGGP